MKETFDFNKIKNFDKHIELSIPNYDGLFDIFTNIAIEYIPPEGICVDLGCSTGKFLTQLPKVEAEYVGVDFVDMGTRENQFDYVQMDILEYLKSLHYADVIVSMFTLQFIGNRKRLHIIAELRRLINGGATLLMAEKVYIDDSKINTILHKSHYRQKRQHFTSDEILDKDFQLSGSMFCKNQTEIEYELNCLGKYTQVWQSYNFKG